MTATPAATAAVSLRAGRAEDAAAVAELHALSWRTAYVGIVPAELLGDGLLQERQEVWAIRLTADYGEPANTPHLLIAENTAGELIGFGYLVPQPDGRVLLDNLHVRPGHTGAGLGATLLRAARAWTAAHHPGAPLHLEVLRENQRAITFYERAGGVRTDEREAEMAGGFLLREYEYTWEKP